MDFGALPPEVNSARMYAGPGSESMLAAAAAWDGLAAELQSTAASYEAVIAGLTSGEWQGPTAATMAAAATPYAAWMHATAAQAEQTATQARAAAAAYETAFAATVPPPLISANRAQLASLMSTNIFGQNTAAIMATEAQYMEMWAQDAAAMYGYAGSSATAASQMRPFNPPPPTTNPDGQAVQAAAVAQAAGTSAATSSPGIVSQLLQLLANVGTSYNSAAANFLNTLFGVPYASQVYNDLITLGFAESKTVLPANDIMITTIFGMVQFQKFFHPVVPFSPDIASLLPALGAGLGVQSASEMSSAGSAVSASVGRAGLVGALSVPPSWAAATPAIRMVASALPGTGMGAPEVLAGASGSLFGEMALAGLAGRALAGTGTAAGGRLTSRKKQLEPARLERVVRELQKNPGNPGVQHWHSDKEGLESLLAELSTKPGIHAVHISKNKPAPPVSPSD